MSQLIGGSDSLSPWDRIAKPVDKFSWDLNALRWIVTQQEERIKSLEYLITRAMKLNEGLENVSHETKKGRPKKVENAA